MRNLLEYPITDQEIVETLKRFAADIDADIACNVSAGDIDSLILTAAADIIASRKIGETMLKEANTTITRLMAVADTAAQCLVDGRSAHDMDAEKVFWLAGGHRRIRLADALKALKE